MRVSRRVFVVTALLMATVAAAIRVHNATTFPGLRAYDGFSHFVYVWFLGETGRIPLAEQGWEFFQPPLYYAFMAALWNGLETIDPVRRLEIGTIAIALFGLVHGFVAYRICRRCLPDNRIAQLAAAGLPLFVPVQLYSAGFIGNEPLNACLCSVSLLALVWTLEKPTWRRAVPLGLCLGLAMLVKFTALVVVAGAFGTLFLGAVVRREYRAPLKLMVVAAVMMLSVCGWFYGRNVVTYGTPFQMSRDQFMLRRVENFQTTGRRTLAEYLLFDPGIIYRPQWPRGLPINGVRSDSAPYSALRESVWTGVYANTWFDGFGGFTLPPVTHSERSRRAGQLLLSFGLLPTGLVLIGILAACSRMRRNGWDDTIAASLLTFAAMLTVFVHATRVVPMHAAVKATYLTPVAALFGVWLGFGVDRVMRWRSETVAPMVAGLLLAATASSIVFTHGGWIGQGWLEGVRSGAAWQNLYGIVQYAGGNLDEAERLFSASADQDWRLGHENLAALRLDSGRHLESLYRLKRAAQLQRRDRFGLPEDRAHYMKLEQAEYRNTMAVVYERMGRLGSAIRSAEASVAGDPTVPEAHYNLAALRLMRAKRAAKDEGRWTVTLLEQARRGLELGLLLDPIFFEARELLGVTQALQGDCAGASASIRAARAPHPGIHRLYPEITGPGDMHSAAIGRRRRLKPLPASLDPDQRLAECQPLTANGA